MKKLLTLAIVFMLIVPMFSVLLPKVQAVQTDSEDALSSPYSAFRDLVSSTQEESYSNLIPIAERTQKTSNQPKDDHADFGTTFSGLGLFDNSVYGSNKNLFTSPRALSEKTAYSTTSSGGIYIDYAKTGDDPYDQYDFGTTVELKIDVDNSDPGTRNVDVFVYMWTPGHHGVDMDKTYNWAVQGTVDDPKWFYLDVGFEHLEYVGLKWPIDITVRDSSTYIVQDEKRVFVTIGPILSDHFTCKDYNNPYGTKTTTFYDTDEKAVEYTLWDTHNLWITWSVKFKFFGPMGEYWTSDWVDLQPGYYEYWAAAWIWIKDHVPAYNPGSWYVDVLLEDHFRARDNFEIVATVLPSLDVNLVSPADGSTVETSPIELKARVTSAGSAVQDALVRFYVSGGEVDSDYSDSSGYASINYYPPATDTYSWYAKAEKSGYTEDTSSTWSFTYSPPPILYTISLSSRTTDGQTNVGSITFDAQTYSLATAVSKSSGTYQVTANPPTEYGFDLWEYSGSISVSNPASQTTSVTVSGDCTLKAVFSKALIPDFEISVDPSSATLDQGSSTTATVTVTSINEYSYSVSLSAKGHPSGVTITFDPPSGTPTFTSTMTLQVAYDVPEDTYSITIEGIGSDGTIHSRTFTLEVNALTIFTDKERMSVATMGPITVPLLTTLNTFSIYWVSKPETASISEYRSAFLQHLGIDLVLEGYKDYPATFALIIEYQQVNLLTYLNEHYGWALPSWLLSNIGSAYQSADGAIRFVIPIGFSVLNPSLLLRIAAIAADIYKALDNCAKNPWEFIEALTHLTQDMIDLMEEYFNIGLYVFKGLLTTAGEYTARMLINALSTAKSILNLLEIVFVAKDLIHYLKLLSTAIFWLRMGVDIIFIGPGTVDLIKELISVGADFFVALLEQTWTDPNWWQDLILTAVRLLARALDPPETGVYASVHNASSGELLLGYDPASDIMINESDFGFMLRSNSSQYFVLLRASSYELTMTTIGEEIITLPYIISFTDEYANETYGTSGWLETGESISLLLTMDETSTEVSNYLIINASASTFCPIQGELVTVDALITDDAGNPVPDAEVALLVNNITWMTADNLGSGEYRATIDTWSILGLVPVVIYADYPDTTTGYYVVVLHVSDAPPEINILSPQNTTYTTDMVDLTFTISEPTSWIGYSLDGQANITITGNITLNGLAEGPHHIIVYANDTYGNMGFSNKVYFTIDTIPPTTSISLSGTLGLDDWYVSDVTVALTAADDVSGVAITAYSFDGTTWITYTESFTISTEGITTIYYNSTDNAGNMESTKSTTVKIDKTNPMTTIDLKGILGNDGWYLSDVTVTLGASDAVSGILKIEYSFDGITWIIYTTPFTIDTEGTTTAYVRSTDNAGNVKTGTFDVKIDKTPPDLTKSLSGTLGNNDWYVSDVTVTLSGSDTVSGLASIQYSFDGTVWYTYSTPFLISSEGITTLHHKVSDVAGNEFVLPPQQIKIDKTSPVTTDTLSGTFSNGWYTSDVTITLDAFDATSGVENTYYKVDSGIEQIYSAPFLVSGDGPHVIEFWSTDNAGNIETHNTDTFQIDTTAPITTASLSGTLGLNDWYVTSVQVTLTAEDPGEFSTPPTGSGVYKTYYTLDGGTQTEYTGSFAVSGQGSHTVQFWSVDIAGNIAANTVGFKIDTIAPVTTASQSPDGNNGWWKTSPATVALSASDTTSGVMEIHYQVDSGAYMVEPGASVLVAIEGNGIYTINYYAVDYAGNQEAEKTETVKIDTTSPTTTLDIGAPQFTIGPDVYVTSTTSFTLSPSDNPEGSGVAATYYRAYPVGTVPPSFDSGTSFQIGGDDGEYTIEYYSIDTAGNEESVNMETIVLDNTPPVTTKTVGDPSFSDFITSATVICLDSSDSGAGVKGTYYRVNDGLWIPYSGCFTIFGPDGTYTIAFYSVDHLDNVEIVHVQTHTLDNTAPTSSVSLSGTIGDNDWFVSSVDVELSADDSSGSGVAAIYYKLDDGDTMTFSASFLVTEDGWHTVEFWSVDNLVNTESPHNTESFKIDTTPPAISALVDPPIPDGLNGWYLSDVTITLTATDNVSYVAFIRYRINGCPWQEINEALPVKTVTFLIEDDGIHVVEFYAQDNAGNDGPPELLTIKIDQTEPISDPPLIGDPYYFLEVYYVSKSTTFALSATDSLSGVDYIEYKIDSGGWIRYTDPFTVPVIGDHTIFYRSVDMAGNIEQVQTLDIVVNATKLTYIGDVSGQYSDPVTVEATLIDMAAQQPIYCKTITFTIGTQTVTSHTNTDGVATASIILDQPAGAYTVSAVFAGDEEYLGSSDTQPFTIQKEDATIEYTGDTVVPTTARTIDLRATIFDSPDGWWGDLKKIQVTFRIYTAPIDLDNPVSVIGPITVTQTDMLGVGVAVVEIPNLPENGYVIIVRIDEDNNNYYRGPTSNPIPLTVYEPTGEFVTGGGWIWDPSGSKGNFGFNARYTRSGRPKGHSLYVYREDGWDYIVKSNAWIGLAIEENHAFFETKCVVQKYNPATEELVWAEGNYKLRVDVWDNDSDGGVDVYQIRVRDKHGVLFHEAGFDPFGELQGGNIVIHDKRWKNP